MTDSSRDRDWLILGLDPGADRETIRKAYRRRKQLYSPENLATYSLLTDQEREDQLARIDEAFRRLMGTEPAGESAAEAAAAPDLSLPPDPVASPGSYLRHCREEQGLALTQITDRTKILPQQLSLLEAENFASLPAAVFVRGFVIQYARVLRIPEPNALANHYLARMAEHSRDT